MKVTQAEDYSMRVQTLNVSKGRANKDARYRERHRDTYNARNSQRMREVRRVPEFIGVDSEGIGRGSHHRAVLLGVGKEQYVASNLSIGLQWQEVFEFLYGQYQQSRSAAYVGFYLGYDFNQWLRTLPLKAARSLLTLEGQAARLIHHKARREFQSVKVDRWEVDMMGFKRLSIRPRPVGCTCYEQSIKCEHERLPWMHVCDAGPFYQMSFLAVLDKERWKNDPGGWPVTQKEYDLILRGKNKRATAHLDDDMRYYNALENEILARVMTRLAYGFESIGIRLAKDQWYGPGATASKWLTKHDVPKREQLRRKTATAKPLIPKWFWDACRKSYFGGWFEIFSHGLIGGQSYNYDINNAYPFATSTLPHICNACSYARGQGSYDGSGAYVLVYSTVFANSSRIGPVPYRDSKGGILRPAVAKGWYWRSELDAARRAGLVKRTIDHEWMEFIPCSHPTPFTEVQDLYYKRLEVGKNGAQGMAIKLNNNSLYGKCAQSVGSAPFNNWLYASYITSACRSQILDAIATHPDKADSVLMVATDGICFDSPHPTLPVSTRLGEWDATTYTDLVLFKPGVYWHKDGKDALLKVKSRGVPKAEFLEACQIAEELFAGWALKLWRPSAYPDYITWPYFYVPVKFRMQTCKLALNQGKWNTAGEVLDQIELRQDSNPEAKRAKPRWNGNKQRIDTVIRDVPVTQIETKYHGDLRIEGIDIGIGFDGNVLSGIIEAASVLRDKKANYNLPLEDGYEWENVWGGE